MKSKLFPGKPLIILAGFFILSRLIFSIPVFLDNSRTFASTDGVAYDQIALNMLEGHGFSKSSSEPYDKDSTITPGYPFFLACIYALFGHSQVVVVLIQIILWVFVLAMLYRFVHERFGEKAALWASLLFIIDVNSALFTTQLTTESLFTIVLVATLILVLEVFEAGVMGKTLLAGVLLGIATLVRPIAVYFAFPVLIYVLITKISWKKLARWGIIFGLQLVVISPWVIRNRVVFGEFFYTTISDVNMLRYQAAPLKAAFEHKTRDAAQEELEHESLQGKTWINEAQYFRILGSGAKSYIVKHPLAYVGSLAMGGLATLVYPLPMRETVVYFRGEINLPKLNVAQRVILEALKGRLLPALKIAWQERLRYFGLAVFILFITYTVFHIIMLAFGLKAYIIKGMRDGAMLLFFITGLYFLGLVGFGVTPRMRVPLEPLIVALAGIGMVSKRVKPGNGSKKQKKVDGGE
jgi:4-amino-4-deoxy-L-arabinose transferase-like glycosyltransferase